MQTKPTRPISQRLALMLGALALYGLLLTVFLYIYNLPSSDIEDPGEFYEGIYQPSIDPILKYELKPNAQPFINADGFIGPDRTLEKPSGVYRIVGLGDSISMYQSALGNNYLMRLEKLLNKHDHRQRYEVLNFAVAGYDTPQEVRRLELSALQYDPDLVILGYCLYDGFECTFTFDKMKDIVAILQNSPHDRKKLERLKQTDIEANERFYRFTEFFKRLLHPKKQIISRSQFLDMILDSDKFKECQTALTQLSQIAERKDFRVLVAIFPLLLDYDDYIFVDFHNALKSEFEKFGFDSLDLLPHYKKVGHNALLKKGDSFDHVHPNSEGHRIAAQAILEWFNDTNKHLP